MSNFSIEWDPAIIMLSIGIAFIGAYGGIVLCEQFRLCSKENQPKLLSRNALMWLMAASLGGVAIWTMHFVGMSAMTLTDPDGIGVEISFRLDLTLVSLVVVIFLCYCGIYVSSRDKVYVNDKEDTVDTFIKDATSMTIQELRAMKHKNYVLFVTLFKNMKGIALGGVINASGVCVMHYIGMEAMVIDHAEMSWDAGIVTASVLIALVAATAANWILFRLLALYPSLEILRVASAAIAAIAVNGMHYTGMAAMKLEYIPESLHPDAIPTGVIIVPQKTATIGAIIASMIFLWLIVLAVMADLRAWFYNTSQIIRNVDMLAKNAENDPDTTGELLKFIETYNHIRNHDFYATRSGDKNGSQSVKVRSNAGTFVKQGSAKGGGGSAAAVGALEGGSRQSSRYNSEQGQSMIHQSDSHYHNNFNGYAAATAAGGADSTRSVGGGGSRASNYDVAPFASGNHVVKKPSTAATNNTNIDEMSHKGLGGMLHTPHAVVHRSSIASNTSHKSATVACGADTDTAADTAANAAAVSAALSVATVVSVTVSGVSTGVTSPVNGSSFVSSAPHPVLPQAHPRDQTAASSSATTSPGTTANGSANVNANAAGDHAALSTGVVLQQHQMPAVSSAVMMLAQMEDLDDLVERGL